VSPWQLRRGPPGTPRWSGHEKSAGGLRPCITKICSQGCCWAGAPAPPFKGTRVPPGVTVQAIVSLSL
jgi:hypothetical protein